MRKLFVLNSDDCKYASRGKSDSPVIHSLELTLCSLQSTGAALFDSFAVAQTDRRPSVVFAV